MPDLDHFGFIAPWYDRAMPYREGEKLASLLSLPISGRLLDAGGGTGRVAQALGGKAPQIIVADLSLGMLKQAKNKNGLLCACSASEQLPFKDGEFERVIMVDAFHHVKDQARTAAELYRVLKPGGILVVIEPDIRTWAVKLIAVMEKILLMRSHLLPAERIASLFSMQNAATRIDRQGYEFRIVVEKTP